MGTIYRNGVPFVGSGGAGGVEMTMAEYELLPESEKMNGAIYFITDGDVSYPSASQMRYDNTESQIPSTTVQGAIDELKIEIGDTDISSIGDGTLSGAVSELKNGLLRIARFTGISVTIDYQDNATIGYRTTEQTKVDLRTKSGFPTGHNILGGTIAANNDLYGSVAWIDGNYCVRAVSKESKTISVTALIFYM